MATTTNRPPPPAPDSASRPPNLFPPHVTQGNTPRLRSEELTGIYTQKATNPAQAPKSTLRLRRRQLR